MSHEVASPNAIAVSIIVPVYNVEAYVSDCLQSILAQTLRETFEIILVDDCSSDDSAAICRQFADAHPHRITLLENPKNMGVSSARNRALEVMRGRYFLFVDPDDLLPPNALAALYQAAEDSQASIVKGNNTIFSDSGNKPARYNVDRRALVLGENILTTLYRHNRVRGHAGGKLFRRKSLGHFRFPPGVSMVEDLYYCCEVFAHADSLLLLNQPVYRYRYRESGASGQKYENGSYLEWLDTVEQTHRFASNARQVRAHRALMVRTLTQLARECRRLPRPLAQSVLAEIEARRRKWDISLAAIIGKHRLGLQSIGHCLKMQFALRDIRRQQAQRDI